MTNIVPNLIRLPDVIRMSGLRRSQLYALAKDGRFPRPVKLSERCSAWVAHEVEEWIGARIASRSSTTSKCQ